MDRASMKAHAKQQISGKIFTLLAITIIIFAACTAIGYILGPLASIATIFISGQITFAQARIYLGITEKSRMPQIEDILVGFKDNNYTRTLLAYLRYDVFVFLWSLLFWVPGIIKAISYSQMFYLLADDKNLDAATAQRKSMEMMEGHKWEYFVLQLSFIPWHLLGMITFGLAYIWVTPYIETTMAEYHVRLVHENKPIVKAAKAVKATVEKAAKTATEKVKSTAAKAKTTTKKTKTATKKSTKKPASKK